MLGTPLSLDDTFPNEVIRMFLEHLLNKQLLGVMRTHPLWQFLGRELLKRFIKQEYPYLATDEILDPLSGAEYIELIEKQQAIYAALLKEKGLSSENVQRADLEKLYKASKADKGHKNFTQKQYEFLAAFAVASDMIDKDLNAPSNKAFKLMTRIGNVGKLKEWLEPSSPPEAAIKWPAISARDKVEALIGAAENGHLPCLTYLLEQCRKEISVADKGVAFRWASDANHQACAQLLEKHLNPTPPFTNVPPQLIFTDRMNVDTSVKNERSLKKRKRKKEEQENENEVPVPTSKKIKGKKNQQK